MVLFSVVNYIRNQHINHKYFGNCSPFLYCCESALSVHILIWQCSGLALSIIWLIGSYIIILVWVG